MLNKITLLAASLFAVTVLADTKTNGHTAKVSDDQVAEILLTIDEAEVSAGKLAVKRAQSAAVKEFAQMMITEHEAHIKETKKVAKENNIDTDKSDTSKALKDEAKNLIKALEKNEDRDFDRAYLTQQINMHEKALKLIDEQLLPVIEDADLKAFVTRTRAVVAAHLARAQELIKSVR